MMTRFRVELRDMVSYGVAGRTARVLVTLLRMMLSTSRRARIARGALLLRLLPTGPAQRWLAAWLQGAIATDPHDVISAHATLGGPGRDGKQVTRTAMLKAPGPNGERGVLYSLFEYNWARILEGTSDNSALLDAYDVVWVASWSPTDYLPLARALASTGPEQLIYVQASNLAEIPMLAMLHPRMRVLPFLPCEAIDPDSFPLDPAVERDVDLLVISNWAPFKRHFELFRALRRMPADLRIVCVGQPELGHTMEEIKGLARAYRVPQQIDFRESIPPATVRSLQVRSKATAIFSRREGHCMSAVEGLFAGASLGLMDGGHVGPVVYINPETGVALRSGHVAEDLMQLISGAAARDPRKWALAHLGADSATTKLNAWLRDRASERSLPWTTDIAHMSWSPYPWVDRPEDRERLGPAVAELTSRFPKAFGPDLLDASRR